MKDPLKKFTIAVTGEFGEPQNHKNLERWIEKNGGRFASCVDDSVTHLLCTWDEWKNKTPKGKLSATVLVTLAGPNSSSDASG